MTMEAINLFHQAPCPVARHGIADALRRHKPDPDRFPFRPDHVHKSARLLKRRRPSIYAGNPCFAGYGNHGEAGTSSPASILTQALNTFLPLALLLFRTIRPAFVFIRARNPWVCFLQWLLGWNVIFAISEHLLTASCVFTHHNMLIIAKRPSDVKRKHFTHTPFFTKKSVPHYDALSFPSL